MFKSIHLIQHVCQNKILWCVVELEFYLFLSFHVSSAPKFLCVLMLSKLDSLINASTIVK